MAAESPELRVLAHLVKACWAADGEFRDSASALPGCSPGTRASSDTADPAAATTPPSLPQARMNSRARFSLQAFDLPGKAFYRSAFIFPWAFRLS